MTEKRFSNGKKALLLLLFFLCLFFYEAVWNLLLQMIFALLVTAAGLPLVKRFEKKLSPTWAASAAMALLTILAVLFLLLLLPLLYRQVQTVAQALPGMFDAAKAQWQKINDALAKRGINLTEQNIQEGGQQMSQLASRLLPGLMEGLKSLGVWAGRLFPAPLYAFYFLRDRDYLSRRLLLLFPVEKRVRTVVAVREMRREISSFWRGQLLDCLVVGVMTSLGLFLVGVPAWLLLGFMMGLSELVPYVGPLFSGALILLFAAPGGLSALLWSLGVVIAIQQLDNTMLSPYFLSTTTRLHPAVVLLSISAGGMIAGGLGMLCALPVLVSIRGLVRVSHIPRQNIRFSGRQ